MAQLKTHKPSGQAPWPLILLTGEPGAGKAQPLHAPIPTPSGWTTMGALSVGDRVFGSNGEPVTITGVHERGVRPVYRLVFSDGATVEACDEHLWATWTKSARNRYHGKGRPLAGERNLRPATVRTTSEIQALLLHGKTSVFIPMSGPVTYSPDCSLPIDPYMLGLLLGDGGLTKSSWPTFSTGDPELLDELAGRLPLGDSLTLHPNGTSAGIRGVATTNALRAMNLICVGSAEKFIPLSYMRATAAQRIELLRGLLDTDGGVDGRSVAYTTVSPALADQVQELIRSLGGVCVRSKREGRYRDVTGELVQCKSAHKLTLRLPTGICPFRLARKAATWRDQRPSLRGQWVPSRTVKEVIYVGEQPVRCITVSAVDHLYLADAFVVTHNSWSAAEFTGSDRVGRCFWLDLGEGCGEEYGEVPGADYEIIDHDGTWVSIIGQVEAVKDVAKTAAGADEPPVVLVIDSMTHEWAMLSEWTDKRARRQKGNIQKLKDDPDVEIDITMNLWNDANSRHNRLMNLVKTFPGIVVLIASEKEVAQLDKGGNPVRNGPKEWKPEGQKFLARDCSVWVRLLREDQPTVVKCRSVHYGIRPGVDRPRKVPDFTLDWLVFELLKCNSKTRARSVAALDADQVMPDEESVEDRKDTVAAPPLNGDRPGHRFNRSEVDTAEAAGDLAKLGELWVKARGDKTKPPPDQGLLDIINAAGNRVKRQKQMNHLFALLDEGGISSSDEDKPRRLKAAQGLLARDSLTTYADLTDAEITEFIETLTGLKKVGTLTQRLIDFGGPPVTALKTVVEELLNAHNVEAAISLMEEVTARPDVEAEVADLLPESDKETLGIREGQSVHLLDLAEKVSHYTEKHKVGPRVVEPAAA